MKYLLDTNVFREIGRPPQHGHVAAWLKTVNDSDLAISALTVREIRKGIAKLRAGKPEEADAIQTRVNEAFDAFGERILPVDREIAGLWGELLAEREKHILDAGLAATARIHNLILVTRNVGDFTGREVALLNPYQASPKVQRV